MVTVRNRASFATRAVADNALRWRGRFRTVRQDAPVLAAQRVKRR